MNTIWEKFKMFFLEVIGRAPTRTYGEDDSRADNRGAESHQIMRNSGIPPAGSNSTAQQTWIF